tara:strand:- start:427 stop:1173 length:747 start_codon:yes stop_codon:yes gene_type:complete
MESFKQKRANLLNDNPIASHGSWISKHSIAAGSPPHQGGSYKQSPLDQRLQNIDSNDLSAEVYRTPAVTGFDTDSYNVVQNINKDTDYKDPYTPKQLAERVDVKTGNALDYNSTHGTVEVQGGSGANELRKRKSINLENVSNNTSSRSAAYQQLERNTEVPITNREMSTNTWSSSNKKDYPNQTRQKPKTTGKNQDERFDRNRAIDSSSTVNNRNFASKNFQLNKNNQYLSQKRQTKNQAIDYLNRNN